MVDGHVSGLVARGGGSGGAAAAGSGAGSEPPPPVPPAQPPPPPRGLARWFWRAPLLVFALRCDFLFGKRFLRLTHIGRKTGRPHHAALEVIRHEVETGVYFVAAGWGDRAHWVRNIRANPHVELRIGGREFPAVAEILPDSWAREELLEYARRNQRLWRWLMRMAGYEVTRDTRPEDLTGAMRVVSFRPDPEAE